MAQISILNAAISAQSALFGGIVGTFLSHRYAIQRDREQRRREFVAQYLIEAWRNIDIATRQSLDDTKSAEALEKALTDVQLFGSIEQVELARRVAIDITNDRMSSDNITALRKNLCNELRQELGLKEIAEPFAFRIFHPKKKAAIQPKGAGI